jgi:transaldolase/glucose-6-phosphate isomerase
MLLGMGGSSLCPEVWKETSAASRARRNCWCSTHGPGASHVVQAIIDPTRTLFIVSSKSGSTLEPNIFKAYFFDKTKHAVGAGKAARHFVAVTDPGSNLEKEAKADGFRHIFPGLKSIGGRYSALSNFGMVPAAAMGLDVATLLAGAERMLHACGPDVAAQNNPGLVLGTILGVAATKGIDKLTIVASPGSTTSAPGSSSSSPSPPARRARESSRRSRTRRGAVGLRGRSDVSYVRLEDAPDPLQDSAIAALEKAGHPVVTIRVPTRYDLAAEFFRWEIATPIAGAILGINPFNQPDVEASKIATRALTDQYEKTGTLPPEAPFFEGDGIRLFADAPMPTR